MLSSFMRGIAFLLYSHLRADLTEYEFHIIFPSNFAGVLLSSSVCVTGVKSNFTFM